MRKGVLQERIDSVILFSHLESVYRQNQGRPIEMDLQLSVYSPPPAHPSNSPNARSPLSQPPSIPSPPQSYSKSSSRAPHKHLHSSPSIFPSPDPHLHPTLPHKIPPHTTQNPPSPSKSNPLQPPYLYPPPHKLKTFTQLSGSLTAAQVLLVVLMVFA